MVLGFTRTCVAIFFASLTWQKIKERKLGWQNAKSKKMRLEDEYVRVAG